MKRPLALLGIVLFAGCGESPVEPRVQDPEPNGQQSLASVAVASPIGPIIARGAVVGLAASATDASGASVTASFAWTSGDEAVVQVSPTGMVTGVGPGVTSVEAVAEGVTGRLQITVADADLGAIEALLADPLADGLLTSIGGPNETALRSTWSSCDAATASGSLSSLSDCITQVRTELAAEEEVANRPLRALLELFVDWIEDKLNLS